MREMAFFREIEHVELPWGERSIHCPEFYYDAMMLGAQFLAPTEQVKALLPSERIHPLRVVPWRSIVSVTAFEYRDSDIGPYNEVSIGIPFTLDAASPLFTGTLRKGPEAPRVYVHSLPVTTQIARDADCARRRLRATQASTLPATPSSWPTSSSRRRMAG